MKIDTKHIVIYIICFLVAFVVTVQVRTVNVSEADILRLKKENELRDEINQWKDAYNNSTEKISELNKKIDEYRNASAESNDDVAIIKKELDEISLIAGLTSVKGEGIKINIDDTRALEKIALDAGYYDSNAFLINGVDIMAIINELTIAGAEAISINGQRITALTGIRNVGPTIEINDVSMSAPFTIAVIGDSETLASNISLRGSKIDELKALNIDIGITKESEVIIPLYERKIELKYASPLAQEVTQ